MYIRIRHPGKNTQIRMPPKRKQSTVADRRVRARYGRAAAKRKYRWRRKYTRGGKGFAKAVKNVILKTAETKYISRLLTDTNMEPSAGLPTRWSLRHNAIEYYHIYNNSAPDAVKHPLPIQGDGDGNRNGDEIYATGIRVAGSIQVFTANKSATFRMFLVENNDSVYSAGSNIATYNETFHNVSSSTMLDTFQHDRIRPKYLGTLQVSSRDANDAGDGTINFKRFIPLKRKLTFRQDDSPALATGMKNKFTLMFLPYDKIATTNLAVIGVVSVHTTLYYKDP
jgi:hypothetical protein